MNLNLPCLTNAGGSVMFYVIDFLHLSRQVKPEKSFIELIFHSMKNTVGCVNKEKEA